jgi:hypothetical protein
VPAVAIIGVAVEAFRGLKRGFREGFRGRFEGPAMRLM